MNLCLLVAQGLGCATVLRMMRSEASVCWVTISGETPFEGNILEHFGSPLSSHIEWVPRPPSGGGVKLWAV
jgi:hypothetical protein